MDKKEVESIDESSKLCTTTEKEKIFMTLLSVDINESEWQDYALSLNGNSEISPKS